MNSIRNQRNEENNVVNIEHEFRFKPQIIDARKAILIKRNAVGNLMDE